MLRLQQSTAAQRKTTWTDYMDWKTRTKLSRALHLGDGRHDLGKLRLERGTSDEEAVDVRHRREVRRVLGVGRAAILDADGLSHLRRGLLGDQLADARVRVLRILRRSREAGADGPDGLVRNDHLLGIEQAIDLRELLIHLGEDCVKALLADLLRLANAEDASHARIQNVLELGRKRRVVVHREDPELAAALRVPDQHLRDAHVLHLLHRHLTGERAAALEVAVLRGDLRAVRELVRAVGHVQYRRAHVDVARRRVAGVDVGDQAIEVLDRGRVALPVATDTGLARHGASEGGGNERLR
mmetsp:Transcript_16968/g.37260  ORF Transcript_16968/g.37260 Transcript_16968/m.37260 type:complete len:299 (+) Transcript_16968:40-936(+)